MQPSQIYGQNNAQIANAQQSAQSYQPQISSDNSQAQGANANLAAYQQSLQDPQNQLGNIYNQGLTNANALYGVNPQEIQQANQALAQTQDVMAALPQAVQQGANGRMVTGAQEANRYGQAVAPVQQQLTNQGNALSALQANAGLAQTAAGQFMTGQGQSQQQQLGALQNVYSNAYQQLQNAQSQLQYFDTLAQQGVGLNEQEQGEQAALQTAAAAAQTAAANAATQYFQISQAQNFEAASQAAGYTPAQIMEIQKGIAPTGSLPKTASTNVPFGVNPNNANSSVLNSSFAGGAPSFGAGF